MFSLGGALFGFPAADGHVLPDEGVPEAWLLLFVEEYADSGVYEGLFTASKSGQTWVLTTTPTIQLKLYTTEVESIDEWGARLTRHCEALAARGALPASLRVSCDDSAESAAACEAIVGAFSGSGVRVTDIQVHDEAEQRPCAVYTAFLQRAMADFAHLRGLSLHPCPTSLPPPAALPRLRQLHLSIDRFRSTDEVSYSCLRSCAAYLLQLTVFSIDDSHYADYWPLLFNPATTTHTLTHFTYEMPVYDELLGPLLQHAPALNELHVGVLSMEADYSEKQWAVRRLSLEYPHDISALLRLPTCSTGIVWVGIDLETEVIIDTAQVSLSPAHTHSLTRECTPTCTCIVYNVGSAAVVSLSTVHTLAIHTHAQKTLWVCVLGCHACRVSVLRCCAGCQSGRYGLTRSASSRLPPYPQPTTLQPSAPH